MGHSTAGIFCRNVAYWKPARVAGVLHIKSGNFQQQEHLPPTGSLAGIPLLAFNGQFETFGPEGGLRAEYGPNPVGLRPQGHRSSSSPATSTT